jgi:hypothetical protein
MLENLSGAVAFAMYEDRLVQAVMDDRIAEAVAARKVAQAHRSPRGWRMTTAKALIALATLLAPATRTPSTSVSV